MCVGSELARCINLTYWRSQKLELGGANWGSKDPKSRQKTAWGGGSELASAKGSVAALKSAPSLALVAGPQRLRQRP